MTMFTPFTRRALAQPLRLRQTPIAAARSLRPFSQRTAVLARKDTQDKDSLKPEPNEYSKSGSDDAAAAMEDAAFDPSKTRPEDAKASADKESGDGASPLEVSPANQEVSKPRDPQEGGNEGSSAQSGQGPSDRSRTSGGGSPSKGGEGKRYE